MLRHVLSFGAAWKGVSAVGSGVESGHAFLATWKNRAVAPPLLARCHRILEALINKQALMRLRLFDILYRDVHCVGHRAALFEVLVRARL